MIFNVDNSIHSKHEKPKIHNNQEIPSTSSESLTLLFATSSSTSLALFFATSASSVLWNMVPSRILTALDLLFAYAIFLIMRCVQCFW